MNVRKKAKNIGIRGAELLGASGLGVIGCVYGGATVELGKYLVYEFMAEPEMVVPLAFPIFGALTVECASEGLNLIYNALNPHKDPLPLERPVPSLLYHVLEKPPKP